jgi:hypothetical protein
VFGTKDELKKSKGKKKNKIKKTRTLKALLKAEYSSILPPLLPI